MRSLLIFCNAYDKGDMCVYRDDGSSVSRAASTLVCWKESGWIYAINWAESVWLAIRETGRAATPVENGEPT